MVQLSHGYMTTGKTIALTRWNFVSEVMSLLFNTLSRMVIIAKFRLKLKKVRKITRPFRYDLFKSLMNIQ